jgi:hypothetical protein
MKISFSCSLLSLLLLAIPAFGEGSIMPKLVTNQCATLALSSGGIPQVETAQGSCSASCGDMGGTVTVSCSGTCTIVDQDCDAGVQGYVQCQGGARADCAACQWCTAETFCPEGGSVSCGTWGEPFDDCQGGNGLCFVRCDNQYQFCPGHFGQIACGF